MQMADMRQICKQPLSHATVLKGRDAADLKGTDAAAMSLWNRDVLAAASVPFITVACVPFRHVTWPQLKVGIPSEAGQCIKVRSQAQSASSPGCIRHHR